MSISPQMVASHPGTAVHAAPSALRASAVLGVLGVVYGDIGTSPLYALKASLDHFNIGNAGVTTQETLGVLSLVFWALVLIVTVKYVALVMRADNKGEGGTLPPCLTRRNHPMPPSPVPQVLAMPPHPRGSP